MVSYTHGELDCHIFYNYLTEYQVAHVRKYYV